MPAFVRPLSRRGSFLVALVASVCLWLCGVLLIGLPVRCYAGDPPPTLDPTYGRPLPKLHAPTKVEADADWIWTDETRDNQTVALRGTIRLVRVPSQALIYVTADDFFTLYVNGQEVDHSQPDPKDGFVWQHVHRLDVGRYLTPGKNVIALRAVNAGGAAGALLRMEADKHPILLTGRDWKASEASGLTDDWITTRFDDTAWHPARVVGPLTSDPWASAGGIDGWPGYQARDSAPYMAHMSLPPAALIDVHNGAGKFDIDPKQPAAITVRLALPGSADPPSLVVDFGKEIAGRVEIHTQGADKSVIVGTGESREEAINSPWSGTHRLDINDRLTGYTPYSAFRYAKITFLAPSTGVEATVPIAISVDHKYYPVEYKGSFSCSDPLLTRIWYTGAYTAHLCMQEDIWDAPKRDRARWMGDLHVSGAVIDTVFADRFLMEQTMQRLRDEAQGGQPENALPKAHVNGIPGYSCAWICGLADFHRHLGDRAYLLKQHDLLVSLLDYLRGDLDERGVFVNKHGAWPFVDWSPDFNADGPRTRTATHLFLIKATKEAAFLFTEMDDAAHAEECSRWAADLTQKAQDHLLQPDHLTFSDRRQDNAMAIYSGAATREQADAIYNAVLQPDSAAWKVMATPYYNNYVIYAMSLAGHTDAALNVVRRYWGGMLAEGATSWWEGYDPTWEKSDFHAHLQADNGTGYFVSLCHGWSAGPTSWLTERVLGVRPTGAGYKTVEIEPELADLQWAEGDVPTPHGALHIRVNRRAGGYDLVIKLPPGVTATVHTPGKTRKLDRPGRYALATGGR